MKSSASTCIWAGSVPSLSSTRVNNKPSSEASANIAACTQTSSVR